MGKERALIGSLGVSGSQALQSPVVTNAVVELVALARLSLLALASAVNLVNLAARHENHQRVAVVHNFYLGVAQKNVGGLRGGANPSGMCGSDGYGRARRYREVEEGGEMSRVRIYDLAKKLKPEHKKILKVAR